MTGHAWTFHAVAIGPPVGFFRVSVPPDPVGESLLLLRRPDHLDILVAVHAQQDHVVVLEVLEHEALIRILLAAWPAPLAREDQDDDVAPVVFQRKPQTLGVPADDVRGDVARHQVVEHVPVAVDHRGFVRVPFIQVVVVGVDASGLLRRQAALLQPRGEAPESGLGGGVVVPGAGCIAGDDRIEHRQQGVQLGVDDRTEVGRMGVGRDHSASEPGGRVAGPVGTVAVSGVVQPRLPAPASPRAKAATAVMNTASRSVVRSFSALGGRPFSTRSGVWRPVAENRGSLQRPLQKLQELLAVPREPQEGGDRLSLAVEDRVQRQGDRSELLLLVVHLIS